MIDRRALLSGMAIAGAAKSANVAAVTSPASARRRSPGVARPDVVVVIADDMCATDWRALSRTRNTLDAGTFYTNFYFNTPLCDPSRTALLTGQCGHNNGVVWNMRDGENSSYSVYRRNKLARRSIPYRLRKSGYRTGLFGKFLNSGQTVGDRPAGWDRWVSTPVIQYTDFPLDIDGEMIWFKNGEYVTDTLAEYAQEFIRETPPDQPLFMWFGSNAPHSGPGDTPPVPARRHRSKFATAIMPRTAAFNEPDVSDKAQFVRDRLPLTSEQIGYGDLLERRRLQSLLALDEAIVAIVKTLEDAGRLDNTCIFIASDNGFQTGQHRLINKKAVPYVESMRVPMLAWGAPFKRGDSSRLVANIDIAPTIAGLAGVRMAQADGISLLSDVHRNEVLSEFTPWDAWPLIGWGLHTVRYSYFEHANGERELFDLRADPLQLSNLLPPSPLPQPALPLDLPSPQELSARLSVLKQCRGATCH